MAVILFNLFQLGLLLLACWLIACPRSRRH